MKPFLPRTGAHFLYNLLLGTALALSAPAWIPWTLIAAKRRNNFPDRAGMRIPPIPAPCGKKRIWIHAVSVGETLSAVPLVRLLRKRLPDARILLSTVTITGQETAKKTLGPEIDACFYFPFDVPGISRKFIDLVRPDIVVILETEIWPNFLAECFRRGIPAVILNGRISGRSSRGYRRFRFLFSRVLRGLSAITTQSKEDADRFIALGADPGVVEVTGNMKFDVAVPAGRSSSVRIVMEREKEAGALWFVAGSTHDTEEEAVLGAFGEARKRNGALRLLLAPRHPERFGPVEELCRGEGWVTGRMTRIPENPGGAVPPVLLLDTVGDLLSAYAAADIAFVGGSLVPKGGHNILEPALFGVPTLVGPHMENFREIAALFSGSSAVGQVRSPEELSVRLARWAADPSAEAGMGRRAQEILDAFRGATERNAGIVARILEEPRGRRR